MIRLTFTIVLLFFTFLAFSQDEFVPGYYINIEGDKIDCLIKKLGWKNTPQHFRYKLDKKGSPEKMERQNIREFGIKESRRFIKYTVDVDQSFNDEFQDKVNSAYAIDAKIIGTDSLPDWRNETLLLEIVVEGDVDLLNYQSGAKNRFFIVFFT